MCHQLWIALIGLLATRLSTSRAFQTDPNENKIPIKLGNACDLRVDADLSYQSCRADAYTDWLTYDQTQRNRYSCCFHWDLVDCQEASVYALCEPTQWADEFRGFRDLKQAWIYQREKHQCNEYRYGSPKCRFSVWAMAGLGVAGVVVILAVTVLFCYCCVWRRSLRNRYSSVNRAQQKPW